MAKMTIDNSQTVYLLTLDEPVVLVEKTVRMGETDVHGRYEVTGAQVKVWSSGESDVTLQGYRLRKRGALAAKGWNNKHVGAFGPIPHVWVTTCPPDGELTFDDSEWRALTDAALDAVGVTR